VNQLLTQYKDEIERILEKYPANFKRSAVMPLLYIAQRERGYVNRAMMVEIGEILGISSTDVASIAGFYSLYYEEPHGRYHIQVCTDLPCAMRGADEFLQKLCDYLEVKPGETTSDGLFTVEAVKCLAACHRAPMFQVQGDGEIKYREDQTLETAKAWVQEVRERTALEKQAGGAGGPA
jgi:NADH-quinone oxidoreductase subunit E